MASKLMAESNPGCACEGLGSGQEFAHHLWWKAGAQRPVSTPLTEAQHNKGYKLALEGAESS